jgi:NADPH:quinone reductase-like Zn-dependent oxidoreductase
MQTAFYVKQGPAREVLQVGAQPTPDPGPGEVRVHLKTSGVNPSDSRSSRTAPMSASLIIRHSDGTGDIDRVGSGVVNRIGRSGFGTGCCGTSSSFSAKGTNSSVGNLQWPSSIASVSA